jgi:ATP-binding cassette, subfamily G (WHITE), member 2, PDR
VAATSSTEVEPRRGASSESEEEASVHQVITTKSEPIIALDQQPTCISLYSELTFERSELARMASNFSQAIELNKHTTLLELQQNDPRLNPTDPSFDFRLWTRSLMLAMEEKRIKRPRVDVAIRNLKVIGARNDLRLHKTVGSALMTPIGFASISKRRQQQRKTILHDFNGIIKSGEMLLVLGRPGSGCTTTLKSISGHLEGAEIAPDSEIRYNGVPQAVYVKNLRGEVLYNQENEFDFPHLTVCQTLQFAAEARAPSQNIQGIPRQQYCKYVTEIALSIYGLSHARDTRVGDDYLRGVSGGERKRVSIAEMAVTGALVGAWDNSTRGLDAATALDFVRGLKTSAEIMGLTHVVALYQASQATYELFDKVTLLCEGRQIYFGPTTCASEYFELMGWERPPRMTTGDFLTSITNPSERKARKGYEMRVPRTAEEFERYWHHSLEYKHCLEELSNLGRNDGEGAAALQKFKAFHQGVQSKHTRPGYPYRISVAMQVRLCVRRAYQRMWNDKPSVVSKFVAQIVQGLIVGSIFYTTPNTTAAFFSKGSVLFCGVLVNTLLSVAEIPALFAQRKIVEKHAHYAFYHPAAEAFASVVADFPIKIITRSTILGFGRSCP